MRFLFTTLPTNDLGLLTRSLPIAAILRSRGHEVIFSSPARAPRKLVADAGFDNRVPPHPIFELSVEGGLRGLLHILLRRRWRAYGSALSFLRRIAVALPIRRPPRTRDVWNMDHAGALMGLLNEGFVRACTEALMRLIDESQPDVVVDFWNPFAVMAARALGVPIATVIQADAHPDSRGFLWWRTPPADLPTPAPIINRVLADHGLPPIRTLADLSTGDLTLVVGTRETDPLPESADVTYVGSILWQRRDAALPRSVASLPSDRPLVWVYSGNPRYGSRDDSLDSIVVLEASIAALAKLDVHVVITTGHHPLPRKLLPLPPNFRHEPFVPGLAMAERSDVLVHHGGYGSCQTALHAGRASVIMPTYSERESNARRMESIGAAIRVPVDVSADGRKRVDARALRAAVWRAIVDRSYAESARRAGDRLRAEGGAEKAAELIERLPEAGSGRGPSSSPIPVLSKTGRVHKTVFPGRDA
jgi:UDP:flavonoid glycosyltransferase YjiC (YdhE family)